MRFEQISEKSGYHRVDSTGPGATVGAPPARVPGRRVRPGIGIADSIGSPAAGPVPSYIAEMADDARFRWIVDTMALRPGDRVLEIGPGSSASIGCVAGALESGEYIGVDRSAAAVTRARTRYAALVEVGRVRLVQAGVEQLRLDRPVDGISFGSGTFDKVLAVNVNLFWTKPPVTELALIRRLLGAGGTLALFYGYGSPDTATAVGPKPSSDKLVGYLDAAGFDSRAVTAGDLLGVLARPR
ncbi:class I SAM-dependent methyltransferase [Nocardia sp. NPDC127579]|uniref:class I SAM-dependent methyltransferase n=1 Tax=Nocardia sp. NPDC127579 TaxID=3345402 RepID=UPI00362B2A69